MRGGHSASVTETEKEYETNSLLYLYTEEKADKGDQVQHSNAIEAHRSHHRNPDAAFFQRGAPISTEQVYFNKAAREIGMLVSVEAKQTHDNVHSNEALLECKRDFVSLTYSVPSARMCAGYSMITDGYNWYFLRMHWIYDSDAREWLRCIVMSSKIPFDETARLARWLWFVFHNSLHEKEFPTDIEKGSRPFTFSYTQPKRGLWVWRRTKEEETLTMTKVFSAGIRCVTVQWESSSRNEGRRVVLKQAVQVFKAERLTKVMKYCEREFQFLQELAKSGQNTVTIANNMPAPSFESGVWLNYAGLPLEQFDICGKRGQQIAIILKRDIWSNALVSLHKCRISHGDIHQANVLVCLAESDKGKAVLIDFESAKRYGSDFEDSPVRLLRYARAGEDVDKIAVAALLHCLWSVDVDDFGTIEQDIEKLRGLRYGVRVKAIVDNVPQNNSTPTPNSRPPSCLLSQSLIERTLYPFHPLFLLCLGRKQTKPKARATNDLLDALYMMHTSA